MFFLASHAVSAQEFRAWGLETMDRIERDLLGADGLYGEDARPGSRPTQPAFTWGVGVMLSALNSAAEADPKYRSRLRKYIDATVRYWNTAPPVAGYDVHPVPKPTDRYYDDNEWMVLALADSAKILHSSGPLKLAEDAFVFVMSGHDSQLGGGIYWKETEKNSKNTCSNGPAAAAALALYDATRKPRYLEIAKDLYSWTKGRLRDPQDGLYWDSLSIQGRVEKTKWSYNTGLMLRTAADLYRITRSDEYAQDVREIQKSSLAHWVSSEGALKDDGKFMHLLLENWLRAFREVPGVEDPRPRVIAGLNWVQTRGRDSLGHYGNRWDREPKAGPYSPFALIDQASVARAFLQAAQTLIN